MGEILTDAVLKLWVGMWRSRENRLLLLSIFTKTGDTPSTALKRGRHA